MLATTSALSTLRASLSLLTPRARRRIYLLTIAQAVSALLDLLGVAMIGLTTAYLAGGSLPPQLRQVLPQNAFDDLPTSTAVAVVLVAGLFLCMKSLASALLSRKTLGVLSNQQAAISAGLADKLLNAPMADVDLQSSQKVAFLLTSGVNAAILITIGQSSVLVGEAALLAILGLALVLISPLVAIASMVYFLVVAVVLHRVVSTWATHVGRTVTRAEAESTETLQEALRGIRELRVSHRMGTYQQRFRRLRLESSSVQGDLSFLTVVPKYVFEIALVLGALLLACLEFAVEPGPAALATIATFLIAGTRIVPSLLRTQGALILVKSATVPANEVEQLSKRLSVGTTGGEASESAIPHRPDSVIELRDVSFTYPNAVRPVVRNANLTVSAGTLLAVVGPSGGGKSTLLDLMSGLLEPDSGSVAIGGLRPQQVARQWPGFVMYVPQSPLVTNGSILANVALGIDETSVDVDRVHEALALVHLQDVVEEHGGVRAPVGELGSRLSGGQRQRLGLARALYGNPNIVLLDEATSALDAESEAIVTTMLEELSSRITVVVVAHRLATLRRSRLIAYIDGGNVTVANSFDELRLSVERFDLQASLSGL